MKQKIVRPELLSPAGDMEKLSAALLYGADAVYFAGAEFGMRSASANFPCDLARAVETCHAAGTRAYITVNSLPRNDEVTRLPAFLEDLEHIGADAAIVADVGVLSLVKKYAPSLRIHISTQTSIVNYAAAQAWHELGANRIVLARELSLSEIREIRDKTSPSLELEAFVHGSMCVSYSGRCLLSNYMAERDANRGRCAQPCRWKYRLMEELRPGEYMEIYEEDNGTYILNSKDLCMIEYIDKLSDAGIGSFKIEGRVKTAYYTAVITGAYRRAISHYMENPDGYVCPDELYNEVCKVSHRQYYTGFYFGDNGAGQYYPDSLYIREWDVAAVVESCDEEGNAVVIQKNRFTSGDYIELVVPLGKLIGFTADKLLDETFLPINAAPHPHMKVRMKLPIAVKPGTMLRKEKSRES